MYVVETTAPSLRTATFQVTKHAAEAISPRKSRFATLSQASVSCTAGKSPPNRTLVGMMKTRPQRKVRLVDAMVS